MLVLIFCNVYKVISINNEQGHNGVMICPSDGSLECTDMNTPLIYVIGIFPILFFSSDIFFFFMSVTDSRLLDIGFY